MAFLDNSSPNISFILVDDGSQDETLPLLESIAQNSRGRVECLPLSTNQGKAEAVRQGTLLALQRSPEVVGYWDADLATPLSTIPIFLSLLEERPNTHMVLGARVNLLGRQIQRNPLRHAAGRVIATCISMALGIESYDTQCGAKAIRVSSRTQNLFADPFETRWLFDVELIGRYLKSVPYGQELGLFEHPLQAWRDVQGSKVRPSDAIISLWELAGLYFSKFRHLPRRQGKRRHFPKHPL